MGIFWLIVYLCFCFEVGTLADEETGTLNNVNEGTIDKRLETRNAQQRTELEVGVLDTDLKISRRESSEAVAKEASSQMNKKDTSGSLSMMSLFLDQIIEVSNKLAELNIDINNRFSNVVDQLNAFNKRVEEVEKQVKERCQSGEVGSYYKTHSWPYEETVKFSPGFAHTPAVTYGIRVLDTEGKDNTRVEITIKSVDRQSVTFSLTKWADTRLYGVWISWMACR